MEFNKVAPELPEVIINMSAASEHVAEVERRIRAVKERCRACMSVMLFKKLPNIMTINLVHFCVFWLNTLLIKTGISYSPWELISRQKVDAKKWCKLLFGDYVEVHEENAIKNSMTPQTRPAICIGPTGNFQGSIKFMYVESGKKIVRRSYSRLSMPK